MAKKNSVTIIASGLIIFLLLFSLSGCGSAPTETTDSPVVEDTDPVEKTVEPVKKIDVTPTTTKTDTKPQTGDPIESLPASDQAKIKLVRKILATARTTEENYFFRYSDPAIMQEDVWVRGDVMKRTIMDYDEVTKQNPYNMVYLFKDTETAEGYCETRKAQCWEGKGPFPERYEHRTIKTPKDWVLELGDDFTWALDNKIADQLYHIIDYNKDGLNIRVWVNDYKGWPYKVEIREDNPSGELIEMYLYDDMDIGGVTADDVNPKIMH